VELTGYGRKYVITLLNHSPVSPSQIVRPRLRIYGQAVQQETTGLLLSKLKQHLGTEPDFCYSSSQEEMEKESLNR
jgi:hypothetical protein